MTEAVTNVLLSEYETLIADFKGDATDEQIIASLVTQHDWTDEGARTILLIARTYGSAILRNALALALAIGIEDGSCGL